MKQELNQIEIAINDAIVQRNNRVSMSHILVDMVSQFEAAGFGFEGSLKVAQIVCNAIKSCKGELSHSEIMKVMDV